MHTVQSDSQLSSFRPNYNTQKYSNKSNVQMAPGLIRSPGPGQLTRGQRAINEISRKAQEVSNKLNRHVTKSHSEFLKWNAKSRESSVKMRTLAEREQEMETDLMLQMSGLLGRSTDMAEMSRKQLETADKMRAVAQTKNKQAIY